jgi:hypothetical protein
MDRDSVIGEWERQIETCVDLDFHEVLAMTKGHCSCYLTQARRGAAHDGRGR